MLKSKNIFQIRTEKRSTSPLSWLTLSFSLSHLFLCWNFQLTKYRTHFILYGFCCRCCFCACDCRWPSSPVSSVSYITFKRNTNKSQKIKVVVKKNKWFWFFLLFLEQEKFFSWLKLHIIILALLYFSLQHHFPQIWILDSGKNLKEIESYNECKCIHGFEQ